MSKRIANIAGQQTPRPLPKADPREPALAPKAATQPDRKPTGAIIYTIEKGANVWPGRSRS